MGLVAVSLLVARGAEGETRAAAGLTSFMQQVMVRGAGRWTAGDLADEVERMGGWIEASAGADHAEIRAGALARHWDRLLALVADVALAPTFPLEEVERERHLIVAQLRARSDAPFPRAFDALTERLFRGHPYAYPTLGREETLATLGREALRRHHAATYRPGSMVLAVSGRVDPHAVLQAASRLFGRSDAGAAGPAAALQASAMMPEPWPGEHVVEHPAGQAVVLVGYVVPGLDHGDHAAVRVLGAVLGSGMGGRLFEGLRDGLGLAYAVGVLAPMRVGPSYLVAHLGMGRERVQAARGELLARLEEMRSDGPTEEEVERARAYLLGDLALDTRTNRRRAWYLAFGELHGLAPGFPDSYRHALARVTTAQVRAAARRYLVRPVIVTLVPR